MINLLCYESKNLYDHIMAPLWLYEIYSLFCGTLMFLTSTQPQYFNYFLKNQYSKKYFKDHCYFYLFKFIKITNIYHLIINVFQNIIQNNFIDMYIYLANPLACPTEP